MDIPNWAKNSKEVWAIAPNKGRKIAAGHLILWNRSDPWNVGFEATITPVVFKSEGSAAKYIAANGIDGHPIKGHIQGPMGFYPGSFEK